ncbi:nSTAND1 domain-containing NTPase [Mastigocoleus testarum]|uniref:nSTAND1 domain-containing NTPase n=1 Tax=Mastigocoleus testarum TaxID=996925 RepID=UPI0007C87B75|nr:CHAT domain-containing protein [Mastigocoleus testarum]
MAKLLVLKLDGDLQMGMQVTLSIALEGYSPHKELNANLPPIPELLTKIDQWRSYYRSLGKSNRAIKAIKVTYDGSIAEKRESCQKSISELQQQLNNWMRSESFRPIRETWLKELKEDESARILIRTSCQQLRQIPWHFWDLLEGYPNIEPALSAPDYYHKPITPTTPTYRDKVKILAILGNSTGIDVEADRRLLNSLPDANVTFLVQPQRHQINDSLWEEPWDILFFAGHSQTVGDSGRIYINENKESLTTDDLKYGLKKAIANGLGLVIFNSCDGLGLACDLEALHIPQMVVMREQVADKVAQVFLKYFLTAFAAERKPLYQAVKEARLKLHGLENDYPCASLLPVICQNSSAVPPTWLDLGRRPSKISPYRGLFAFREEDSQFFFGRENFTDMLLEAVYHQPLVAVIGSSGSGKSSVVFAGLVKHLRDTNNWHFIDFRPGSRPLFSLAAGLVSQEESHLNRTERLRSTRNLASDLKQYENGLLDVIDDILREDPSKRLLLIADQFEELYTLCKDPEERKAFLDRLLEAINNSRNFTFVITLRADFLGQALSYRPFADALQYADLKLGPMTEEELQAAVEKPAALLGVTIEEGLIERILSNVSAEPGDLPLLEFALTQLWGKQQDAQLTHIAYDKIGGVEAALACYAQDAYNQLKSKEKERAQRIFIQLVHPGQGAEDTRRVAIRTEVGEENWDLVSRLADARLVVTGYDEKTGLETVEIVHEALIRNWGQLQEWMQQDRDFRFWQEQLRSAMRTWESSGKDEGGLLRGKPLTDALYWHEKRLVELSLAERNFIKLSLELRSHNSKKQRRRQQFTILGLSSGLIIALSLAGVAWWQSQNSAKNEIISLINATEELLASGQEFDALKNSLKAADKLTQIHQDKADLKLQVTAVLGQALHGVKQFNRLERHTSYVENAIFSPDGQTIVTTSHDRTVKFWNRKGQMLKTFDAHDRILESISFSPDGQIFVTTSQDDTAKLWNREGKLLKTLREDTNHDVNSVAFSPDGKIFATASDDRTVKLWNREGQLLKTFRGHRDWVHSVTFSPDGKILASASKDRTVKLWNREGQILKTLASTEPDGKIEHSERENSVSFSPDGKTLATVGEKIVKLWNKEGELLNSFLGDSTRVNSVKFSPNGQTLATAGNDKKVKIWSREGKLLKTLIGHNALVNSANFSPDGKILASASTDHTVILWNLDNKLFPTLTKHKDWVNSVTFSPDSQILATASNDKTAKLWNRKGELLQTLTGHSDRVNGVGFAPNKGSTSQGIGQRIIVTVSDDKTVKLWNIKGQLLKTLHNAHGDRINSVTFSPNGQIFATASDDKTIKLWNLKGHLVNTFTAQHQDRVNSVTFSTDGKILATTSNDLTVKLWNRQGQLLNTLIGHHSWTRRVAFSPDGKTIATSSLDNNIKLWNRSGKFLKTLTGHRNHVQGLSFSPIRMTTQEGFGQILASASHDGTVKLWNREGQLLKTLTGHSDFVTSAKFSPDGKILATGGWDKKVILWNFDFDDLQKQGCAWLKNYLITHPDALEDLEQCKTPVILADSAPAIILQGEELVKEGDIEGGITKFRTALDWNSQLNFNPITKAKALTLLKEGEYTGQQGDLESMVVKFREALELDTNQANSRFAFSILVRTGKSFARNGKVKQAIAAYAQAEKLTSQKISANYWNILCRFGSLHGYAADVMHFCEKALALAPDDAAIIDSRGIAKALTGNTKGAIEDFQPFILWTNSQNKKSRRQRWIKTLEAGKNPFTTEEIKSLLNEDSDRL